VGAVSSYPPGRPKGTDCAPSGGSERSERGGRFISGADEHLAFGEVGSEGVRDQLLLPLEVF
jgi:hypothetical protein